jgi:uncharacterized membrane protein YcaP (DUF421 family)
MYAVLAILIRVGRQRILTGLSTVDYAAAIAIGAVTGRAILGYTPTLLGGVLGLCTLFLIHWTIVLLRRRYAVPFIDNRPILLVADGRVLPQQLLRAHISDGGLRQRLRVAGIGCYADVAAVVLERTGTMSVVRRGATIADDVFADVHGWELVHPAVERPAVAEEPATGDRRAPV